MSKADGLYKLSKIDKIKVPAFFLYSAQDLNTSIDRELDALKGDSFAVRSSFAGEDGEKHSFAGQFETYLRVPRDKVLEKVQAVQDSLNKASVQVYRQSSGLESKVDSKNITVIVQEMVDAQCAGVCFSRDPMEKPALKKAANWSA
jgi:Phosphoenolpyruvate synthase/pyruvate phosphate dikinase